MNAIIQVGNLREWHMPQLSLLSPLHGRPHMPLSLSDLELVLLA